MWMPRRAEFVAGRRVVIVGGGYIGLEAAAVAAKLGLSRDGAGNGAAHPATGGGARDLGLFPRAAPGAWRDDPGRHRAGAAGGRRWPGHRRAPDRRAGNSGGFRDRGRGDRAGDGAGRGGGAGDRERHPHRCPRAAPRTRISGRRAIARAFPGRAGGCGWKACRTPSTRPNWWPTTSWARGRTMCRCRGSGRISTTASCRSRG